MKVLTTIFVVACSFLHAGWNEDFDTQTELLMQALPDLQNKTYREDYNFFKSVREVLTKDKTLISQLQNSDPEKKLMVINDQFKVMIKKRRYNHIHDAFIWELSYLLGSNKFILPSFPMEIGGIRVIVQRLEKFEYGNIQGGGYSKGTLKKIPVEDYWKAHIQAFLLGLSDMAAANIGVNSKGVIRFFDNEASLIYYNVPFKNELCFSTGFVCQSFDWRQFKTPIDSSTANHLTLFIDNLSNFEEKLRIYLTYRPVSIPFNKFQWRLDTLRNFSYQKGVRFQDLYSTIFPRLSSGLDEMSQIAGSIMQRKIGWGTTLFFTCRRLKDYKLTPDQKAVMNAWVATYIE